MLFKWPCRKAKQWSIPVVEPDQCHRQQAVMDRDWERLRNENTVLRRNVERLLKENADLRHNLALAANDDTCAQLAQEIECLKAEKGELLAQLARALGAKGMT